MKNSITIEDQSDVRTTESMHKKHPYTAPELIRMEPYSIAANPGTGNDGNGEDGSNLS
jgi:hypothetical protein